MASSTVARELVVHGRVQGVYFRASCRDEAVRLGVGGWVRNEPDQTVRIRVEGAVDAVAALVAWAGRGPARAEVTRVTETEVTPTGAQRFDVR